MAAIPVFLSSDNNYAPFVATTMASILLHTKEFIEFYILDCGLSDKNKSKICNSKKYFNNFSLEFINIDMEKFSSLPSIPFVTKAMYARYVICDLKPQIKKAIYSDIDVAFTSDINELFEEDLGSFPLAAVPSQRGKINNDYFELKTKLGLSLNHDFFMSGLLLMDLEKLRQGNYSKKLIDTTVKLFSKLDLPDQEAFNLVFENNYKKLNPKYCVIYKIFNECYTIDEIKNIKQTQVIVHYPGPKESKPWNNKNLPSSEFFWNTVEYTDFKQEIININKVFNKDKNSLVSKLKNVLQKRKILSAVLKIPSKAKFLIQKNVYKKCTDEKLFALFNKHLSEMKKISEFIKPKDREESFDRPFINSLVAHYAKYIKGDVLEFAGGISYAKKYGDKDSKVHIAAALYHKEVYKDADYWFDLENKDTLPSIKFDCIIATQVIMYIFNLKEAMNNLKSMLKPGGVLILSVPGPIFHHSRNTHHMFSFTYESFKKLCEETFGFNNVSEIGCYGNFKYAQYGMFWTKAPIAQENEIPYEDRFACIFGCLCKNNER